MKVLIFRAFRYFIPRFIHRGNVILRREIKVLDLPGLNGETPLHLAVKVNSLEICEKLLKAGVNPNPIDHDGNTPLDTAVSRKSESIVEMLKSYGALPSNRR